MLMNTGIFSVNSHVIFSLINLNHFNVKKVLLSMALCIEFFFFFIFARKQYLPAGSPRPVHINSFREHFLKAVKIKREKKNNGVACRHKSTGGGKKKIVPTIAFAYQRRANKKKQFIFNTNLHTSSYKRIDVIS